jgi:hypothetical protein
MDKESRTFRLPSSLVSDALAEAEKKDCSLTSIVIEALNERLYSKNRFEAEFEAKKKNLNIIEVVDEAIYEHLSSTKRKEIGIKGVKYYPIHITNNGLNEIIHWALSRFSKGGNSKIVETRKSHGGKGIEFVFSYSEVIEEEGFEMNSRRYSFSIDPNWEIRDLFDHWNSAWSEEDKEYKQVATEWLNSYKKGEKLLQELKDEITSKPPEINPLYKTDDFTVIYQIEERNLLNDD